MTTFLYWALGVSAAWVACGTAKKLHAAFKTRFRRAWLYGAMLTVDAWFIVILVLAAGDLR